ncbi:intercellular adhesion molecule 1 isoform X1 [Tamandua tetradactyla]|uniref:intercellular adhesion molecule 1 isoform X1 n=1 Tax=Tamandua tetradactyla TaxID=48850 RepID=UPI0040547BD0
MDPGRTRPALPALPALLALLGALLPGSGSTHTSVDPPEAILPRGGSVRVNCSASCDHPSFLGLETTLTKMEVANGSNWKVFELSDVDQDSTAICFSYCNKQTIASTALTVYWLPDRVELLPLPTWQPVGENVTLRCRVVGGAPRARVAVVLLRGEEELSRQPARGEPAEVTAVALARREDHGANFSCRAELDLRPRGLGLFRNSSAPRQLQTFVLPVTPPRLDAPRVLEVGTTGTVSCSMEGLFPVEEAYVHLALGDQRLSPTIQHKEDALLATANVTAQPDEEGAQRLVCAVILGNQSQDKRETLTIYSFPRPNLTLSEPVASEGTVVTVVCEALAPAMVTLSGAPAPAPTGSPAPHIRLALNASAQDNGRSFSCSATLEVAGQLLHKTETRELEVLYGPRLNEDTCPGNWTWQEGSQQTLRCQAWGNPAPQLECHRKGDRASLLIGELMSVKRELAGVYECRAISVRGEVSHQVVVTVLHHQGNLVAIILVAGALVLGTTAAATYYYNRQRKIRKYKLQKAQEAACIKLNTAATPP